ncbi:MAG: hypothetical protein IPM66_10425 [Acidobacteriota bacterium]|nr:MAG: hypothetical protein IPM66_10425 [Acidobacteriota bacterium]
MAKAIGSAVAGYIVIFILVFLLMTAAWYAVGAQGAFKQGVWDVTPMWLGLMLTAGLLAAIIGGYVTALITSDSRGWKILAGIVIVLGVIFALPVLMGSMPEAPLPRPDNLPMFEAMQNGRQPAWVAIINPVVGAIGVMIGSRLRSGR